MPTKSKGGNKQKKQKNGAREEERRDLLFREDGQAYARVERMLGWYFYTYMYLPS